MPLRLKALVAFHAVIVLVAMLIAVAQPLGDWYFDLIRQGIFMGQIGLLSLWLGMGTDSFNKRLLGILVATVYLSALVTGWRRLADPSPRSVLDFVSTFLLAQGLIWFSAAAFFAVRKWASCLRRVPDPARLPKARPQFTIFQTLLLTTVVALTDTVMEGRNCHAAEFQAAV